MIRQRALLTGAAAGLAYAITLFVTWKSGVPVLANFLTFYTYTPIILLAIGGTAWWLAVKSGMELSFRDVLQFCLLAYLVYELAYAVSNYSLFAKLDPQLNSELVDHLLETTRKKLESNGAGKDQKEAVEDLANAGRAPLTLMQTLIGLGQNMLIDFLKSLFIATITKQNIFQKA